MLITILCLSQFSFPGGSARSLADELYSKFHKPVAILLAPGQTYPKFSIDTDEITDFLRVLRRKYHYDTPPKDKQTLGLAADGWPHHLLLQIDGSNLYTDPLPVDTKTTLTCIDGKVDISNGSTRTITLQQLRSAFSKSGYRLESLKFYEMCRFVLSCHSENLQDVCKAVGVALGSDVVIDEKEHLVTFGLDVKAMRRRAVRLFENSIQFGVSGNSQVEYENARYEFHRVFWSNIKDSTIASIYNEEWKSYNQPEGNPIHTAAIQQLPILIKYFDASPSGKWLAEKLRTVDPHDPINITPTSDGKTGRGYMIKDNSPSNKYGYFLLSP